MPAWTQDLRRHQEFFQILIKHSLLFCSLNNTFNFFFSPLISVLLKFPWKATNLASDVAWIVVSLPAGSQTLGERAFYKFILMSLAKIPKISFIIYIHHLVFSILLFNLSSPLEHYGSHVLSDSLMRYALKSCISSLLVRA